MAMSPTETGVSRQARMILEPARVAHQPEHVRQFGGLILREAHMGWQILGGCMLQHDRVHLGLLGRRWVIEISA